MRIFILFISILLASCSPPKAPYVSTIISGKTASEVSYLTIDKDTLWVENGVFLDTLFLDKARYGYLKLDTWKWPKIIYFDLGKNLSLDFRKGIIEVGNDDFNTFLLNKDSILTPYSARWNMSDSAFRAAWYEELPENFAKINSFFDGTAVSPALVFEALQMELMKQGHSTANFISYQENNGETINRDIYDFVPAINFQNPRLAFHENNRNFQYYYFLDKVSDATPDSIYPFAAIDTIKNNVAIKDIRNMIIGNVVKSGLYDDSVDHDALFAIYEKEIGKMEDDDKILGIYQQIQNLKPGNKAPDFGKLLNLKGDPIALADFKGQPILLSVWGSWCPYCKEELPYIKDLLKKHPGKFQAVGVSLDRNDEKWRKAVKDDQWPGVQLNDPNRSSIFRKKYLASGTNIHFLIDKNGVIRANL